MFAGSVAACFGASALYHRVTWTPAVRLWMRRVDHAGVYLLIAGTYTPVCLLVLSGAWRLVLLAIVWAGAVAAILLKFVWVEAPKWLAALIGIALGWVGVVVLPQLVTHLKPVAGKDYHVETCVPFRFRCRQSGRRHQPFGQNFVATCGDRRGPATREGNAESCEHSGRKVGIHAAAPDGNHEAAQAWANDARGAVHRAVERHAIGHVDRLHQFADEEEGRQHHQEKRYQDRHGRRQCGATGAPVTEVINREQRVGENSRKDDVAEKRLHDDHRKQRDDPKEHTEKDSLLLH